MKRCTGRGATAGTKYGEGGPAAQAEEGGRLGRFGGGRTMAAFELEVLVEGVGLLLELAGPETPSLGP